MNRIYSIFHFVGSKLVCPPGDIVKKYYLIYWSERVVSILIFRHFELSVLKTKGSVQARSLLE